MMSGIRKLFISLFCISLLLGIANQAFSFEYLGYKYDSLPVSFYFNSAGSDDFPGNDNEFQALKASFDTWQNVSGSAWTWSYQGTTSQGYYDGFDGKNVCEWIESGWPYGWGAIAVTHIIADDDTGQVLDTDIAFNGEDFEWSIGGSGMDIQNIATHEIGHTLVLDDLYDSEDREKTMYGRASRGETKKRTLDQDDINGIRYIYPGTKPTPPPTPTPTPTPPTPPTPPPPTPPTPTPPTPFLLGDVSGDGEISAYDAALTAQASVGLITLTAEQTQAADVSGNNKVSTYDAALIAQRAVGLINKFPAE